MQKKRKKSLIRSKLKMAERERERERERREREYLSVEKSKRPENEL